MQICVYQQPLYIDKFTDWVFALDIISVSTSTVAFLICLKRKGRTENYVGVCEANMPYFEQLSHSQCIPILKPDKLLFFFYSKNTKFISASRYQQSENTMHIIKPIDVLFFFFILINLHFSSSLFCAVVFCVWRKFKKKTLACREQRMAEAVNCVFLLFHQLVIGWRCQMKNPFRNDALLLLKWRNRAPMTQTKTPYFRTLIDKQNSSITKYGHQ